MKRSLIAVIIALLPLQANAQAPAPADPALVAKGRELFSDKRLSGSGTVSCADCHPASGFTDNKTYVGLQVVADGTPEGRSTPSLLGSGIKQADWSWAGNIPDIKTNMRGIIVNRMKGAEPSKETLEALEAVVRSFPLPTSSAVNQDGELKPSAPADVKRGYALFTGKAGCMTCHVPAAYDKKGPEDVGSGGTFKVPTLRDVGRTGPYFHDGRFKTLDEAVDFMWQAFRKKTDSKDTLTDPEKRDIVAFLKAL